MKLLLLLPLSLPFAGGARGRSGVILTSFATGAGPLKARRAGLELVLELGRCVRALHNLAQRRVLRKWTYHGAKDVLQSFVQVCPFSTK